MPQTPVLDTVAMLQKQIAGYCLLGTDPEALETALAGMHRAVDRLNTRVWNSAASYDDLLFVTGQTEYQLSSAFKAPRNLELWDTDGNAIDRLAFKSWKTFLMEHPDVTAESSPCVYSVSNVTEFGTLTLNCTPSTDWVSRYPEGRIWYFRRFDYPAVNAALRWPSEMTAFVQSWAEGYTADRFAKEKAPEAYSRAREQLHELIVDDCHGGQTDWE